VLVRLTDWSPTDLRGQSYDHRSHRSAISVLKEMKKRPEADPRSFVELGTSPIRRPGFGSGLLNRLVGVAR
jgi:hypothetical protein